MEFFREVCLCARLCISMSCFCIGCVSYSHIVFAWSILLGPGSLRRRQGRFFTHNGILCRFYSISSKFTLKINSVSGGFFTFAHAKYCGKWETFIKRGHEVSGWIIRYAIFAIVQLLKPNEFITAYMNLLYLNDFQYCSNICNYFLMMTLK
jgi:hypothetical protein